MSEQISDGWLHRQAATIRRCVKDLKMPRLELFFVAVGGLSTLVIAVVTFYALFFQVIPRFQLDKTNEVLAQTEKQLEESKVNLSVTSERLRIEMKKVAAAEVMLQELDRETQDLVMRHLVFNARMALPLSRENAQLLLSIDEDPNVEVRILESDSDRMLVRVSRGLNPYVVRLFNSQSVRTSTRNGKQLLQQIFKISKYLHKEQKEEIAGELYQRQ